MTTELDTLVMPLGMTKKPIGWPMMAQAYIDFALFATGKPEFIKAFEDETGIIYKQPKCGLDELIDTATGQKEFVISNFLDWLTVNHWGEEPL